MGEKGHWFREWDGDRQWALGYGSTEIPLSRHREHPGWESFLNSLGCDSVLKRNLFVCRSSQDVSFLFFGGPEVSIGWVFPSWGPNSFLNPFSSRKLWGFKPNAFLVKVLISLQFIPLREEGFWSISCTSNLPLLKPSSQICFISVLLQPQTRLYLDYFRAIKFKWEEHTFNLTLPRSTLTS